jgi:hypothetical protein
MTKSELTEMIREAIRELAFESLRSNSKKREEKKAFKPKGLTEDELEYAVFYGGQKPNKDGSLQSIITIKESYSGGIPKINSSDITKFEDDLEKSISIVDGASIVFDKQSNGYSMKAWVDSKGINAGASGRVEMGNKGTINWAYSLQNGLTISTEKLVVEKGNKLVIEKLFGNYDSWQKDWREKLTINSSEPESGENIESEVPPSPEAPAV